MMDDRNGRYNSSDRGGRFGGDDYGRSNGYGGGSSGGYGGRSNSYGGASGGYGGRSNGYGGGGSSGGYGGGRSNGGGGYGDSGRGYGGGGRGRQDDWGANRKPLNVTHSKEPFEKVFFNPSARVSHTEAEEFRKRHEISVVRGGNIPPPIFEFSEAGLPTFAMQCIRAQGYDKPTAVQSQGWSIAMSGHNLVAIAMTGSGKTMGYLLPGAVHAQAAQTKSNNSLGPIVVVLAPTRELAQQIHEIAEVIGKHANMYSVCLTGGSPKGPQIRGLEQGCDFVVATPGRINDIIEMGKINLSRVSYVVLDEADRMLDMGFEPQIKRVLEAIRPDRQMLMWSATWPESVQRLAQTFLNDDYVHINIGSTTLSANPNILQLVDVCHDSEKDRRLSKLMEEIERNGEKDRVIIFVETKRKADEIVMTLRRDGFPAKGIHGDKSQEERDWVLSEFRDGKVHILVATDVAARGLDVENVKVVINYDYPGNSEDYIHRIGRTGRKGNSGTAYTFFTQKNRYKAADLVEVLREANQKVDPKLEEMARSGNGGGNYRGGGGWY